MTTAHGQTLRADRIAGAMFGAAYGDALGSSFEFLSNDVIERHLGSPIARDFEPALRGSLLHPRAPGGPTDDTAMALSVAFAIASGEALTADHFASCFLRDLDRNDGRFADMFWQGGPGGATTRALRRLQTGATPATCGHPEDGGNGAAMRAHPAGFLRDRNAVLRASAVQAQVTHGHPAAIASAQAVSILVYDALEGVPPSLDVPSGVDDPMFASAWQSAHRELTLDDAGRLPAHLRNAAMSGWATVAAAHAITLLFPSDPARAIGAAAASGGDTDTVASIVGAIVGARAGLAALPERWVSTLDSQASMFCREASDAIVAVWGAIGVRGDGSDSQSDQT